MKISKKAAPWLVLAVTCALFFVVPDLWGTFIAFPVGMLFAQQEEKILPVMKSLWKKLLIAAGSAGIVGACFVLKYLAQGRENQLLMNASDAVGGVVFCVLMYVLCTQIRIVGKPAAFFGKISYVFYLLHDLGILTSYKLFGRENALLFLVAAFAMTVAMAFVIEIAGRKLSGMIIHKK